MLPSAIGTDACSLARRWVLAPTLAKMVVELEGVAKDGFAAAGIQWPGLWIISGQRSAAHQASLNPFAPKSRHIECPSLAVDLRVGNVPASITQEEVWRILGDIWEDMGGRWGGNFRTPDLNHFDVDYTRGHGILTGPGWPLEELLLPASQRKTLVAKVVQWVLRFSGVIT